MYKCCETRLNDHSNAAKQVSEKRASIVSPFSLVYLINLYSVCVLKSSKVSKMSISYELPLSKCPEFISYMPGA